MSGIRYKGQIFSGAASVGDADDVSYDNTESGLAADNVQDAVDELKGYDISGMNPAWCFVTTGIEVTSDGNGWVNVSYKGTQLTTQNCAGLWVCPNNATVSYTCFDRVMHNSNGNWRVRCTDHSGNVLANSTRNLRFFAYVAKNIR